MFQYLKKTTGGWNSFWDYSGSMRKPRGFFHICQLFSSQKNAFQQLVSHANKSRKLNKIWHRALRYRSWSWGGEGGAESGQTHTVSAIIHPAPPPGSFRGACDCGRTPRGCFCWNTSAQRSIRLAPDPPACVPGGCKAPGRINPADQGILLRAQRTDLLLNWHKPVSASPSLRPFSPDEQSALASQVFLGFVSSFRSILFNFWNPPGCEISHGTTVKHLRTTT